MTAQASNRNDARPRSGVVPRYDAPLADGTVVTIRPIEPSDAPALVRFHESLSAESVRLRFFAPHPNLSDREVVRFTTVDHRDREALVATHDDDIIAVARYDRTPDTADAEVAFVVADRWQGTGAGTLLLDHLAAQARQQGIERFIADTLAENRRMATVFQHSGLNPSSSWEQGVLHLEMPLVATPDVVATVERREHTAEAESIARLLRPKSIAVVGASARNASVGNVIVGQLAAGGFTGAVHPVNRTGEAVAGFRATTTVTAIAGDVELAIVAVPPGAVLDVVEQCAAKGVRGLVVITGGFAELGPAGAVLQRDIALATRRHGMRLIGPNCVGVINTDPQVRMHATFGAVRPSEGAIALASQSGAVGIAVLDAATRCGLGVSSFVSLGNKADVSGNDLLQFWEDDPHTAVVLLYLESLGNPSKFARLARRIGRTKPIIAVKSGRTAAGRRAAGSHTAAMASDDAAVDALMLHCGVVRVDTIDELLDAGLVMANQPLPAGTRVAIVGNSGGPGIMAADVCAAAGLELAVFTDATMERLSAGVRSGASITNPVDVLGDAGPAAYAETVAAVMADDAVDMVVAIHTPTLVADPDAVAHAIAHAAGPKPLVAVLIGRDRSTLAGQEGAKVPVFGGVEQAVTALGHAAEHAAWRRRPDTAAVDPPGIDRATAQRVIDDALRANPEGCWLTPDDVNRVLDAYGISRLPTVTARSRHGAKVAARELGFPVALKAVGPELVHKTDAGGVFLHLTTAAAVDRAWIEMAARLGDRMIGATVQPMAATGVETIAGLIRDRAYGPLVVFGIGGTLAELIADRAVRVAPLSPADAHDMLTGLRCSPLLTGYRGSEPVDVEALTDLILRVGALAADLGHVRELDLNPVICGPAGVVAVDARVAVQPLAAEGIELAAAPHLRPIS